MMFYYKRTIIIFIFVLSILIPDYLKGHTTRYVEVDIEDSAVERLSDITISLRLNKPEWIYMLGEEAVFEVEIKIGERLLPDGEVNYVIGLEKMLPTKQGQVNIQNGKADIKVDGLEIPGFLRCNISTNIFGKTYHATATAAYEPEKIKPTVTFPSDFYGFWKEAINDSKKIPLNQLLTPIPEYNSETIETYHIEYQIFNGKPRKFYGILCIPKANGVFPAIIKFPGAGWTPPKGDQINSEQGFITLDLYIHEYPANQCLDFYEELKHGKLKNYMYKGVASRDSFYYKDVILGCIRSVDFINTLNKFDGKNIGAWGSSQGGALSIISASLEPRINFFVALCPAMCDLTGYLNGRAGGWPHFFSKPDSYIADQMKIINTLSYYDVVNFAKSINVPSYFSWGFNDEITPPTSFYAAFNQIVSSKKLFVIPEEVHEINPEQTLKTYNWLKAKLSKSVEVDKDNL